MSSTTSSRKVPSSCDPAPLLKLQQFADSALPIGGLSHSFGLEFLADARLVTAETVEAFLVGYLNEAGTLEAAYCSASCALAQCGFDESAAQNWLAWNTELGARKLARESRDGSAAMGRRFLELAAGVSGIPALLKARDLASSAGVQLQLASCFGLVAGAIGVDPELATCAYLQQAVTALVSCCQRLLPLGQTGAQQILWNLKPAMIDAAKCGSSTALGSAECFTPSLDVASARHATMHTRLFIS